LLFSTYDPLNLEGKISIGYTENMNGDLVEKVITLDNVSLIDFLGVENNNIKEVAAAFPMSKIISRGNEIRIKGTTPEISRITDILDSLIEHYQKYGKLTHENVRSFLKNNEREPVAVLQNDDNVLVYGTKGVIVRAKNRQSTTIG
jgi:phosphate starvation-inducible PhoH-like protein